MPSIYFIVFFVFTNNYHYSNTRSKKTKDGRAAYRVFKTCLKEHKKVIHCYTNITNFGGNKLLYYYNIYQCYQY